MSEGLPYQGKFDGRTVRVVKREAEKPIMEPSQELVKKCEEIRRIWQGPGPRSHELRVAMEEMFALLPEQEPALTVHVKDSLAMRSKFGGQ